MIDNNEMLTTQTNKKISDEDSDENGAAGNGLHIISIVDDNRSMWAVCETEFDSRHFNIVLARVSNM